MASFFEQAIEVVLKHEGGLANNSADPGGITNYGISLRFLEESGIDIDGDGDIDADDIKALTPDTAKPLYYSHFWLPGGYDRLGDPMVATKIFDMSVNMGLSRAHIIAQTAANTCGASLVCDGVLGPKSVAAICSIEPQKYLLAVCDEQSNFYKRLSTQKPALKVFLWGWLHRAAWPFKLIVE